MSETEQLSLSWDSHQKSICSGLSVLQQRGEYVDMTLAADGHYVKVHQMVVSLVSPYIKDLLSTAPCPHPVIFLNNISYTTLCALLEYMYTGEVQVPRHRLADLLSAGKALHIRGLSEMDEKTPEEVSRPHTTIPAKSSISEKLKTLRQKKQAQQEQNLTPSPEPICKVYLSEDDNNHEDAMEVENESVTTDVMSTTDGSKTLNNTKDSDKDTPLPITPDATKKVLLSKKVQYSVSNQGGLQTIYNRYIYNLRYISKKNGNRSWRCVRYANNNNKCRANICTDDNNMVTDRTHEHNHPFDDKRIIKKLSNGNIFTQFKQAESKSILKKNESLSQQGSAMTGDETK